MNNYSALEEICREAWTSEGLSEKTINSYLLVLRRAELFFYSRGTNVLEATATDVRELAQTWRRTRSSRIQLRTALARAWEASERLDGPRGAIRVPSKPKYGCRALGEPQAAVLARHARAHNGPAGLAVLLGLYAGLRREEIASLTWTSIRDGWLVVVGKGDVTGEIPVHPELAKRLALARATSSSHFVFPGRLGGHVTPATVWGWCRALSLEALEIPIATHVLRHTAIATLNDKTRDLRAAQSFARHASPETTVIYTRVSRDRLINAVAAIDY